MQCVIDIPEWQALRKTLSGKTIGLLTTMGNLHAGHLNLCKRSKAENQITVVSIFVNPTQFNQASDFEHYPRTVKQDAELLAAAGVDYVLLPDAKAMYPDNYEVQVTETNLSLELEGKSRPGHFNGMLTVVLKLLNLVQPTRTYFGEKDYQQLLLVKKMVAALLLPVEVVGCPTIRTAESLALSSRNSRLSAEQQKQALQFPQLLQSVHGIPEIIDQLTAQGFKVDYIAEKWQRRLGAVWLDDVRLIDNIPIAE